MAMVIQQQQQQHRKIKQQGESCINEKTTITASNSNAINGNGNGNGNTTTTTTAATATATATATVAAAATRVAATTTATATTTQNKYTCNSLPHLVGSNFSGSLQISGSWWRANTGIMTDVPLGKSTPPIVQLSLQSLWSLKKKKKNNNNNNNNKLLVKDYLNIWMLCNIPMVVPPPNVDVSTSL